VIGGGTATPEPDELGTAEAELLAEGFEDADGFVDGDGLDDAVAEGEGEAGRTMEPPVAGAGPSTLSKVLENV